MDEFDKDELEQAVARLIMRLLAAEGTIATLREEVRERGDTIDRLVGEKKVLAEKAACWDRLGASAVAMFEDGRLPFPAYIRGDGSRMVRVDCVSVPGSVVGSVGKAGLYFWSDNGCGQQVAFNLMLVPQYSSSYPEYVFNNWEKVPAVLEAVPPDQNSGESSGEGSTTAT